MVLRACKTRISVTLLVGASTLLGCGGGVTTSPPPVTAATASSDDAAAGLVEHHRYHHHGGVTLFIAMSLDTLAVLPEEKAAVESVRTRLHARMNPALTAEQNLVVVLADGLASGAIDIAKADASVSLVATTASALANSSVDLLDELHGILTPLEREALVDKVESHWVVWQKANAEEGGSANGEPDHVGVLAADLGLTIDQVDRIRSGLGERTKTVSQFNPLEIATHIRAFGDAFEKEKFDARTLTTASDANAHMAHWGAAHLAHFVETVNPVLTPDQRAKLAQRLREHATHNPSVQGNP